MTYCITTNQFNFLFKPLNTSAVSKPDEAIFSDTNIILVPDRLFVILRQKFDQSFVRDIPEDKNDVAIIRAIIAMGQALGLSIIAEGVETKAQSDLLAGVGCDDVQGYFYGKPVPGNQFRIS